MGEHSLSTQPPSTSRTSRGPLPGLARACGAAHRRRAHRGRVHAPGRGHRARGAGRQARSPPRHHQGGAREAGPRARRRAGQGHRRGRHAGGATGQDPRAPARDRQAAIKRRARRPALSRSSSSATSSRSRRRWSTATPQAMVAARSSSWRWGPRRRGDDVAQDGARCAGEAEQEARGAMLVQAIAEREGLTVSDADVQKRIAELAAARATRRRRSSAPSSEKNGRHPQIEGPRSANRRRLIC